MFSLIILLSLSKRAFFTTKSQGTCKFELFSSFSSYSSQLLDIFSWTPLCIELHSMGHIFLWLWKLFDRILCSTKLQLRFWEHSETAKIFPHRGLKVDGYLTQDDSEIRGYKMFPSVVTKTDLNPHFGCHWSWVEKPMEKFIKRNPKWDFIVYFVSTAFTIYGAIQQMYFQ